MKIFRVRTAGVIAAIAITAMALSGCSPSGGSSQGGKGGPTLAVYNGGTGAFTKNFNPLSSTVVGNVNGMIYEPLFFFSGLAKAGTKPVPMLGTKYSFDTTGTKLSVVTRSGVKWSDGKPFTAKDVAFTMNLINATPALNTSGNAPKAEATDDTHVTMTFSRPSFTDGPNILGHTFIVPEHIFKSVKNPATYINDNPVGTGPMTMSSFNSQTYLLKKNPKFWDVDRVKVGAIRMYSLSGNEAAANKLISGGLDWTGIFVPNIKKTLANKANIGFTLWGSPTIVLATCSNAKLGCTGPQADPVVRQAMSAAINRQQVNKLAYSGTGSAPSATLVAPSADNYIASAYKSRISMSADVKASDSLLQGDGWVKGSDGIYAKGGERLSLNALVTSGYTDYISIMQTIAEQYKTAGIEFNVKQVANQEINSSAGLGTFQVIIAGIQPGPTSDPYYIYNGSFNGTATGPVGKSVNPYGNFSRFSDPEVDKAIAAAGSTEDQATKAKAYATIQASITKDLPYIPVLSNGAAAEFSTKQVTGWPTQDNQYAAASPWATPDNEQVLLHLKVK